MTASLRIVVAMVVVACALAALLAVDLATGRHPIDRAIVPGLAVDHVTSLQWRDRTATRRLVRVGDTWRWDDPPGDGEPRAVLDVLATLRGARWQRTAAPTAVGESTTDLTIEATSGRYHIALASALGDQRWLVVDDERALLVDGWVAGSLFPDPLALRVRAPLAAAADADQLSISDRTAVITQLRGHPRQLVVHRGKPTAVMVDSAIVDRLASALVGIEIVALPDGVVVAGDRGLAIAVDSRPVIQLASDRAVCTRVEGWPVVGAASGPGCITDRAYRALAEVVGALEGELATVVERRIAPITPTKVTWTSPGGVLDLSKRPVIADRDADPARVAELLTALMAVGEASPRPPVPVVQTLIVEASKGTAIVVELLGSPWVARRGEPVAMRVSDAAYALIARPPRSYRDLTPWREEPTTIHTLTIGSAKRYTRSPTLGEWSARSEIVDRLVSGLALPRVLGETTIAIPSGRQFELAVSPIGGTPHTLRGTLAPSRDGCVLVTGEAQLVVIAELCELAGQL